MRRLVAGLVGLGAASAGLAAGCGHGGKRIDGKAALLRPPTPYDPQADSAGEDMGSPGRRGLVLLPVVMPALEGSDWSHGPDPRAAAAWHDAYALVAKACDDSFYIWAADSRISATEQAMGERAGVLTRDDRRAWALRFTCLAKPHASDDPALAEGAGAHGAAPAPAGK